MTPRTDTPKDRHPDRQAAMLARLREKGLGLAPHVEGGRIVRSKRESKRPAAGGVLAGRTAPQGPSGVVGHPDDLKPADRHAAPQAVTFIVDGEPVSKERPRFTTRGGKPRTYTPGKTLAAERAVKDAFEAAAPGYTFAADASYTVEATFFNGTRRHRDVDNMLKLVLDGLNGVAWADDHQVVKIATGKAYAPGQARTVVTISRAA